jgi:hypothetical protein
MVMKLEHFQRKIRYTLQLLNVLLEKAEKTNWTNRVRKVVVLQRIKEEMNILHTIQRRKANWNGHILYTNCFLKHVIEG